MSRIARQAKFSDMRNTTLQPLQLLSTDLHLVTRLKIITSLPEDGNICIQLVDFYDDQQTNFYNHQNIKY
jgi:hypothetical protein